MRVAERGSYGRLVLEAEEVRRSAGVTLQLHSGVEQHRVRPGDARLVVFEQRPVGGLGPGEGVRVAQSAASFLEVGFQSESDLPRLLVPQGDPRPELGEPALRPVLPEAGCAFGQFVGQGLITGEAAWT